MDIPMTKMHGGRRYSFHSSYRETEPRARDRAYAEAEYQRSRGKLAVVKIYLYQLIGFPKVPRNLRRHYVVYVRNS